MTAVCLCPACLPVPLSLPGSSPLSAGRAVEKCNPTKPSSTLRLTLLLSFTDSAPSPPSLLSLLRNPFPDRSLHHLFSQWVRLAFLFFARIACLSAWDPNCSKHHHLGALDCPRPAPRLDSRSPRVLASAPSPPSGMRLARLYDSGFLVRSGTPRSTHRRSAIGYSSPSGARLPSLDGARQLSPKAIRTRPPRCTSLRWSSRPPPGFARRACSSTGL